MKQFGVVQRGWSGGERLGVSDIEIGGGEMGAAEGFDERRLIDGGAATDIIEDRAALHPGKTRCVEKPARPRVVGQDVYDVLRLADGVRGDDGDAFVAGGAAADGGDPHAERREEFHEAAGDRPKAENHEALADEQARGRPADAIRPAARTALLGEGLRKLAGVGEDELRARARRRARRGRWNCWSVAPPARRGRRGTPAYRNECIPRCSPAPSAGGGFASRLPHPAGRRRHQRPRGSR